ncbi:MAG TPA: ribosome biogenesis GTP-binding protein YihA/YsxC [Blastocatellia bacterium]|nr:ribosome biogenesis GTP-binding protein YihA/YsxC [Blastocatellia bacterium]
MRVKSAVFVKSATSPEHYPRDGRAEVAFMGRSNVGKSSLINSLLGVKGLAKTSSTPGRTQLINFFRINDAFNFVDLPGYGYARVPTEVKREWGPMIEKYLATRPNLVLSILITDLRHEPSKLDLLMKEWLSERGMPFVIVATKADKLSGNQLRTHLSRASAVLGKENLIIAYSAVTRSGADRLWKEITTKVADFGSGRPLVKPSGSHAD